MARPWDSSSPLGPSGRFVLSLWQMRWEGGCLSPPLILVAVLSWPGSPDSLLFLLVHCFFYGMVTFQPLLLSRRQEHVCPSPFCFFEAEFLMLLLLYSVDQGGLELRATPTSAFQVHYHHWLPSFILPYDFLTKSAAFY